MIKNKNPSNFPPGPWPVPFLGTVFTKMDFRTMAKLAEVYGKVFSLRVSSDKIVIISGYKMVKEALITQNAKCPSVSQIFILKRSISLSNGYLWRSHRKFAAFHLRMFGEGKKSLEHSIQQKCVYLCDAFKTEKGPFNPLTILNGAVSNTLYNVCPRLLEYLPGPHQTIFSNYKKITNFLRGEIIKHKDDWDPSNPLLFFFSTEKEVIGQSRQPCLADRVKMPYTDAVIHEIQRLGDVVPLGFPKKAVKDTTLGGYFIPKGTAVSTILSSVLHDPNEWETPDTFNPGHFLTENGQFRKRDAFLPFSSGNIL
uniref:Cytochrome P450, family 2, subfamily AD, polypeptide 2 n=1 Tax=Sinocyclocheilus anshuiensis TaxID=1608454 RepID=A0A671PNG2_9TELE